LRDRPQPAAPVPQRDVPRGRHRGGLHAHRRRRPRAGGRRGGRPGRRRGGRGRGVRRDRAVTTAASPFQRLAPYIREFIFRQGWTELRGMQVEAIEAILDTNEHVLLAGQTASGKTEAAFLPILTDLERNPSASIGVLYVGPLKALINDQFQRLDHLLEAAEIPVWPWHGDVSQSVKNRAVKSAQGVMQITPESLEGFMLYRKEHLHRLFHDLRYVVVDEVHAFQDSDRGGQLQSLLERITRHT